MGCANQFVVNVRNVRDTTAEFQFSFSPDTEWVMPSVGKQHLFEFRKHKYSLTLLQIAGSAARIQIDPVLPEVLPNSS